MTDLAEAPPEVTAVTTPAPVVPADATGVAPVADEVLRLVRSFNRQRGRMLAAAKHDVEWSAHMALKILETEGPLRAGALAECLQSDPSTVSRQVAAMVRDGLLERQADPQDGRASLLVLTDHARDVLAEHDQMRICFYADIVEGWSDAELRAFTAMLTRFTDAYDEYIGSGRMNDRLTTLRPGGNR